MAKQKVVVKLSLCCEKERTKALKTAVSMNGVESVELDGDKLVVTVDGTDVVGLATRLRKKLGYAELISVTTVEEKKEKENKQDKENKSPEEIEIVPPLSYQYQYSYPYPYTYYQIAYDYPKWYSIF